MDSLKVWRASTSGRQFTGERRRGKQKFESAAVKHQYRDNRSSKIDALLGFSTPDPMEIIAESAGVKWGEKKSSSSNQAKAMSKIKGFDDLRPDPNYVYPDHQKLVWGFGLAANGLNCAPPKGATPPRNPGKMECIPWTRRGVCEKFNSTGWCPWDHPSGDDGLRAAQDGSNIRTWLEAPLPITTGSDSCRPIEAELCRVNECYLGLSEPKL